MEKTATPRQKKILQFIHSSSIRNNYSPTLQEIGDEMGLTRVTVFEHVDALVKKGLLLRGPKHKARSLRLAPKAPIEDQRSGKIPLVGRIAAGNPIEAVEDRESLDLEGLFTSPDAFALEVQGDSMIDEHIRPGDYVICRPCPTPRNGQAVVALLEDGEATLKTFYKEKDRIRLQPANPEYPPLYPEKIDIQGVVVGLVRKV